MKESISEMAEAFGFVEPPVAPPPASPEPRLPGEGTFFEKSEALRTAVDAAVAELENNGTRFDVRATRALAHLRAAQKEAT